MVSGFAALDNVDDLFVAMNQVPEEFRQNFSCPFILWMNDAVYIRRLRIAPDVEWRGIHAGDSPETLNYFQKSLEFWKHQTHVGAGFTANPSAETDNVTKPAPFPAVDVNFTDTRSNQTDNLNQPTLMEEPGEIIEQDLS